MKEDKVKANIKLQNVAELYSDILRFTNRRFYRKIEFELSG